MRRLLYTAAAAAALAFGSTGANAAALIVGGTTNTITPPASDTFGNSFGSAVTPVTPGMFTDVFNLMLTGASLADASLISVSLAGGNNIDFTCATCSVKLDTTAFTQTSAGSLDVFTLNPTNISAGSHTLTVTGNIVAGPTAAYAGTVNFNTPNAVPEAATWAMMLLGFAGMGMVIRRRQRPVLAQLA